MTDVGHNSGHGQLRSFVDRIERLETEQRAIDADKKEVYAEAKATGFNVKVMKRIIAERRKDPNQFAEEEVIMDLYRQALDMVPVWDEPPAETASRAPAREDVADMETAAESPPAAAVSEPVSERAGVTDSEPEAAGGVPEPASPADTLELPPFLDRRRK